MSNHRIDAAFCSSKLNECYIFVKERYVVVNCAPGAKKEHIVHRPIHISDGFPFLEKTPFENVIDCAFDTDSNEVFIFSGNQCAKIDYSPDSEDTKLLDGPAPITTMFPCLKGTAFEDGIDTAVGLGTNTACFFKGKEYAFINYAAKSIHSRVNLISLGFKCLVGTVFENGIDAAFNSRFQNQIYVFKGEYYACFDGGSADFIIDGRVKRFYDDWPALHGILKY